MVECIKAEVIPGYIFGLTQPSLLTSLRFNKLGNTAELLRRLAMILEPHISTECSAKFQRSGHGSDIKALATAIGASVSGLQEAAGIPVFAPPHVIEKSPERRSPPSVQTTSLQLLMPSLDAPSAMPALQWILRLLDSLLRSPKQNTLLAQQQAELKTLMEVLRSAAPRGSNNIRFIRAANAIGIPVIRIPGDLFQYGWGKEARWFKSSITDETSAIGVGQSKDKCLTNATLRMGGIPVPAGRQVRNIADALTLAKQLNYPVVVKPANLDQGIGVSADLRNDDEVREAYAQAKKYSPIIMLEQHIKGIPFRITVFRGKSVGTVQRLPAGVTGDGVSTVERLIEHTNQDPRRTSSHFSIMKPILIDDESRMLLARMSMDLNTVPAKGQFVALRRAANLSTGGDAIAMNADCIHPSYARLAERATKLLRLDVAAVDFITPDINKAYPEVGAAIIEVNAQPQMGSILPHIHELLLKTYVRGDGCIPSILVMGSNRANIVREIRDAPSLISSCLGSVSAEGVFIGRQRVTTSKQEGVAETRALLIDPSVTALLVTTAPAKLLQEGLPLPFFQHVVLADLPDEWPMLAMALSVIRHHLRGKVWLVQNHPLQHRIEKIFSPEKIRPFTSHDQMLSAICLALNGENQ